MGLDIVELVMEVEDAFGIQIPDEDYEQIRTVGDLHDYIVRHRQHPDVEDSNKARVCLTSATFLRLRRVFIQLFGISRRSVRTSSQLDELVPRVNRREKWNQLQEMVQLKLPALKRPVWLFFLLTVCVISLASCFLWLIVPLGLPGVLGTLLLMIATSMGLAALTRPFATVPGFEFATVGGLSRVVLQYNFRKLHENYNGSNSSDIWTTLQMIIVEQLGVNPDIVTRDATFIEDLGCD